MSIGTVRCQSSSLPLPKHRGKEKPAGTAMPAGFPLSGEILVTHGSANVRSIGQARALGKPYFISRKVFSTRSSTSTRLNAASSKNLAHVRMICNVARARSSFLSEVLSALLFITDFVFSGLYSFRAVACHLPRARRVSSAPLHFRTALAASLRAAHHGTAGAALTHAAQRAPHGRVGGVKLDRARRLTSEE